MIKVVKFRGGILPLLPATPGIPSNSPHLSPCPRGSWLRNEDPQEVLFETCTPSEIQDRYHQKDMFERSIHVWYLY